MHVHSGCDTTCRFFGHGQKTIYDNGTNTEIARGLLKEIGTILPVTEEILQNMSQFTIRFIYGDKKAQLWEKPEL